MIILRHTKVTHERSIHMPPSIQTKVIPKTTSLLVTKLGRNKPVNQRQDINRHLTNHQSHTIRNAYLVQRIDGVPYHHLP